MIKLVYPDGNYSKEELEEIIRISLEMRRRVKEQLKKIGGMEFYDVNFSYIDNETFEEKYVSVPEQGSSTLIPEGICNPGQVYTCLLYTSFRKLRENIIKNKTIYSLLHMGRGIFGIDFGSTSFVIKNGVTENFNGKYFRLHERNFQYIEIDDIEKIFLNANKNDEYVFDFDNYQLKGNNIVHNKKIVYYNNQENFNNIPGMPIACLLYTSRCV